MHSSLLSWHLHHHHMYHMHFQHFLSSITHNPLQCDHPFPLNRLEGLNSRHVWVSCVVWLQVTHILPVWISVLMYSSQCSSLSLCSCSLFSPCLLSFLSSLPSFFLFHKQKSTILLLKQLYWLIFWSLQSDKPKLKLLSKGLNHKYENVTLAEK